MVTPLTIQPNPQQTLAQLAPLIPRAEAGDAGAIEELRTLMTQPGVTAALGGDLGNNARRRLAAMCSIGLRVMDDAILQHAENLWSELAGPNPTPAERLIAERAANAWLVTSYLEQAFLKRESHEAKEADLLVKAIARSEKRYLHAIRSLEEVRRLQRPNIRVRIASPKQKRVVAAVDPN